jgi:hypothetical protein
MNATINPPKAIAQKAREAAEFAELSAAERNRRLPHTMSRVMEAVGSITRKFKQVTKRNPDITVTGTFVTCICKPEEVEVVTILFGQTKLKEVQASAILDKQTRLPVASKVTGVIY